MSHDNKEHDSSTDPELRYFPRWAVEQPVECQLEGERGTREGKTKDLSCAGACIVGEWHIAPHQKIKLTIQLSNTLVTLKGHIRWVKPQNDNQQLGITFYNTPDEVQESILQHAFEVDRKKVINQWFKGWNQS